MDFDLLDERYPMVKSILYIEKVDQTGLTGLGKRSDRFHRSCQFWSSTQSSSMAAPLIQSGYANTIMPYMNMYGNSSIVWALLISKEDIQISYLELIELPHHTRLLRN